VSNTRILHGDALAMLRTLPSDSVDCCVTSPPYFALRDYGVPGQYGLESSPQAWLAAMVAVFGEVRRVLKPSGTCWVNVGDKYMSDGGSGRQGKEAERVARMWGVEI
jgi:site-specific DNA-methyltransferase (cytosine-N4-specific)